MKAGDILLFIGGNDVIDAGIRLECHSKFTHAAIAISETEFVEAWWDGTRKSNIKGHSNIVVFTPITPLSEFQQAEIIGYALGKNWRKVQLSSISRFFGRTVCLPQSQSVRLHLQNDLLSNTLPSLQTIVRDRPIARC